MSVADVLTLNSLLSGEYVPTWTTITGFAAAPGGMNVKWHRLGQTVFCYFTGGPVNITATPSSATISLPIVPGAPFPGADELYGTGLSVGVVAANTGPLYFTETVSGNSATLTNLGATDAAATLIGSFAYRLSR